MQQTSVAPKSSHSGRIQDRGDRTPNMATGPEKGKGVLCFPPGGSYLQKTAQGRENSAAPAVKEPHEEQDHWDNSRRTRGQEATGSNHIPLCSMTHAC